MQQKGKDKRTLNKFLEAKANRNNVSHVFDEKKRKKIILTSVGVAVFLLVLPLILTLILKPSSLFGLFQGEYTSGYMDDLKLYPVRSVSEIEETKAKSEFKVAEPILIAFTIKPTDANKEIVFVVYDSAKNIVRKSSFPVLSDPDSKENLVRYATVVMDEESSLEAGNYTLTVEDGESQNEIAKRTFSIK